MRDRRGSHDTLLGVAFEITDMDVRQTAIDGLVVVTLKQVADDRGTVREFFRASAYRDGPFAGLGDWQQINVTETKRAPFAGCTARR